jgi:hypothetical protein
MEKNIPPIFKKRTYSFSAFGRNISTQRFMANLPFTYRGISLKIYNNHIEKYNLYFENYARAVFKKSERITHTIIFTENILQNK